MLRPWWIVCLGVFMGCGKQPPAPPAAPSVAVTNEIESTPGAAQAMDPAQLAAILVELTQTVRKYAAEQRQAPQNLDELVAKGYLTRIPPAPPGKRYSIDKGLQVVLANL